MAVVTPEPLLVVDRLVGGYGRAPVVREVSIDIGRGEIVALLGANGAGKTTLLRIISGLARRTEGSISFDGRRIEAARAHEIVRSGLSHVPEGRQVFPDLTVAENLEVGAYSYLSDRRSFGEGRDKIYQLFPRLAERAGQAAGTLSGGEAQMLVIGRALMSRPKLLMLDEPSLGLAPIAVAEVYDHLKELHRTEALSILLVEQVTSLALGVASRGYVLDRGRVVAVGYGRELRESGALERSGL